ncbi:hypothetical protein DEJ50_20645 [Streptomyces venezuelae]|uniref:Uncharacterized protein n=1 Tax=Streptomyces venezuelae TaxID=54571 RepID=A0A5P2D9C3_STRVZ|nr:hypothetical protein DEJ50_20645 [Streptomyces venezuelae]
MPRWQGWFVGLVGLAALLVFAPLGLYVWASGGSSEPAGAVGVAAAPYVPVEDAAVSGCRIDPASRRLLADIEVKSRAPGVGSYVVTVGFRQDPPLGTAQALVRLDRVAPGIAARGEAVGPVWPAGVTPWCGVVGAEFEGAEFAGPVRVGPSGVGPG